MSTSSLAKKTSSLNIIQEVSGIVSKVTGIQLGEKQEAMVRSRLSKRISELKLSTEEEYFVHLKNNLTKETEALVSLLTTHHTYFFREFSHFEYLSTKGLRAVVDSVRKRGEKTIRVWSAACSRGQEVYSLAMFLNYHLPTIAADFQYEIFGTDVDTESVSIANNGVYFKKDVEEAPLIYLQNHWAKGTGDIQDYIKAKPVIKNHCKFEVRNLLSYKPNPTEKYDIVFCRNVFIYFNSSQIKEITTKLLSHLRPEGLMFIGISESLHGMNLPVASLGPSIFTHVNAIPKASIKDSPSKVFDLPTASTPALPELPNPLRVVCVDDSPSILTLLGKILNKTDGFEVVATAKNGIEAQKVISEFKPDIVTLDIHMPEQTGIEYLAKNFSSSHPPVVMITSAAREEMDLGMKALSSGASDFIEKPSLANMMERGEEIRVKLKCAVRNHQLSKKITLGTDWATRSSENLKNPEKMIRLIVASISDQAKLKGFFSGLRGPQPPAVIFFEGTGGGIDLILKNIQQTLGKTIHLLESETKELLVDQIYLADFSKLFASVKKQNNSRLTSILVFGEISGHGMKHLSPLDGAHLMIEDFSRKNTLTDLAKEVVPVTSFAYMSHQYFENGKK